MKSVKDMIVQVSLIIKLTKRWTKTDANGLTDTGSVRYISYSKKMAASFWVGWGSKSWFCNNSTWADRFTYSTVICLTRNLNRDV